MSEEARHGIRILAEGQKRYYEQKGPRRLLGEIQAQVIEEEIDRLTRERDEARAEVQRWFEWAESKGPGLDEYRRLTLENGRLRASIEEAWAEMGKLGWLLRRHPRHTPIARHMKNLRRALEGAITRASGACTPL